MLITALLSRLNYLWAYLTRPPLTNQTINRHPQPFSLPALSLTLLLAACAIFPIWVLANPHITTAPYIALGVTSLLLSVYALSRSRHYLAGSLTFIATPFALVMAVLLATADPIVRISAYNFLLIAVLLSSILLTVRTTVIVAATSLGLTAVFLFVSGVDFGSSFPVLVFMTVMSALLILVMTIRNRSLEQLTKAQAQYHGLFNQTHDAVFIIDLQGNYLQVNHRATDLLGYSIEELRQINLEDVSLELSETLSIHNRLLIGDHIPVYERLLRRKDGSCFIGEINIELVRDAEDHPLHIQSVVRDISQRKRDEQKLHRQNQYLNLLHGVTVDLLNRRNREALLQSIITHASEIIDAPYVEIILKAGDEMVTCACTANLGFLLGDRSKHGEASLAWKAHDSRQVVTIDDYATYPLRRAIYANTPTSAIACFPIIIGQECLGVLDLSRSEQNQPFTAEELEHGTLFAQLVALLLDNANLHESTVREIAQRKQAEDHLWTILKRQQVLLHAIPDFIFRLDKDGTYLDYQASRSEKLAVQPEYFMGRKISEILPTELAALCMQNINQVLQTGREATFEYALPRDGQLDYFEARMVVSSQDEVITIIRDITERKLLEEQTYALVVETAKSHVLGQFVQNVSHELRTPLSTINSALYLISKTTDAAKRQYYADLATHQVGQLSKLLNTTLRMTELDNAISLNADVINLNDWVHRVIDAAQGKSSRKGLSVTFNPESDLPTIKGDAVWLQEVFGNVLDNAIRFTPEGSVIVVRTFSRLGYALVEFEDTGIGIPDTALPHIFERFWRHDEAHSTPGFGLGLSIALKIVEMHSGRIEVKSISGTGSIFKVLLPLPPTN